MRVGEPTIDWLLKHPGEVQHYFQPARAGGEDLNAPNWRLFWSAVTHRHRFLPLLLLPPHDDRDARAADKRRKRCRPPHSQRPPSGRFNLPSPARRCRLTSSYLGAFFHAEYYWFHLSHTCDGVSRRTLSQSQAFSPSAEAQPRRSPSAQGGNRCRGEPPRDTAVILFWMGVGPSPHRRHVRSQTERSGRVPRRVPRKRDQRHQHLRISEHFPLQARIMDKMSVVRSVTTYEP